MKWFRTLRLSQQQHVPPTATSPSLPATFRYSIADLVVVENNYEKMFSMHRDIHEKIIDSICSDKNASALEVACGPGFCVPLFRKRGISYTGMDISETAIAANAMKYHDIQLINLSIENSAILSPQAFDAVYNSSMLEHIGKFEDAISSMWRLARRRMDLMFFEGLTDGKEHTIKFFPYDRSESQEAWGGEYGMKVALQDHGPRDGRTNAEPVPGYFYSRYAREPMIELLQALPSAIVSHVETLSHMQYGPRTWVTIRRAGAD